MPVPCPPVVIATGTIIQPGLPPLPPDAIMVILPPFVLPDEVAEENEEILVRSIVPPEVVLPVIKKVLVLCVGVKAAPETIVMAPPTVLPDVLILAPAAVVMSSLLTIDNGAPE